uniref:Pentapeptide repeat-containing protein n=1 Tax=Panagrolaimus sp. ES5 TaxID=591445 RepID=A0AC34FG21_9BILA
MAPRYITAKNYEIQVRNCFASVLHAVKNFSADKVATLIKAGLNGLEFTNFDSHIDNDMSSKINYQNSYRLNQRYALIVSGEYSDNDFSVLLMIIDRKAVARFGFKVMVAADLLKKKTFHIIAKVPIFGVQCVINYNPETDYYVFSIRPPLSNVDLNLEKNYAASNECALICLHIDFVSENIFYEVYKNGNESPFGPKEKTSSKHNINDESFQKSVKYGYEQSDFKADFGRQYDFSDNYNFCVTPEAMKYDGKVWETVGRTLGKGFKIVKDNFGNIALDNCDNFQINSEFSEAFAFNECSKSSNLSLTCKSVGKINGLDLNVTYGNDIFGEGSTCVNASYQRELGKDFDLTFSGEYSNTAVTAAIRIYNKFTGISFGVEIELKGDFVELKKKGVYIVIKVPVCKTEFVFKCDVTNILLFFRPIENNDDDKDPNLPNDNDPKPPKDYDHDKQSAAAIGCGLIEIEADFVRVEIIEEIYEYETIKCFAPKKTMEKEKDFCGKSVSLEVYSHEYIRKIEQKHYAAQNYQKMADDIRYEFEKPKFENFRSNYNFDYTRFESREISARDPSNSESNSQSIPRIFSELIKPALTAENICLAANVADVALTAFEVYSFFNGINASGATAPLKQSLRATKTAAFASKAATAATKTAAREAVHATTKFFGHG